MLMSMPPRPAMTEPLSPAPAVRSDRDLLKAHLAGDPAAFGALFRAYQVPLTRLALRWARDADEADDLVQRTFLRALDHSRALSEGTSFRGFLFKAASNLCKNHLRDRARLVFGVPLDLPAPEDDSSDRSSQRRRVRESLAHLSLRQRQVVTLRIDAELSFAQIAESLGITENNAKVTFHNALVRLKALCAAEEPS